tara:strand:- start:504 stop:788 length:285 start_codon:yes stop_codon:yes gene_type:complete
MIWDATANPKGNLLSQSLDSLQQSALIFDAFLKSDLAELLVLLATLVRNHESCQGDAPLLATDSSNPKVAKNDAKDSVLPWINGSIHRFSSIHR